MAIAMVAMLAFGGTYAYFTASTTPKDSGSITTGYISLKAGDSVTLTGNTAALLPKETVKAELSYTDDSTRGTWIVVSATANDSSIASGATLTLADMTTTTSGITLAKYTKGTEVIYLIENSKATSGDTSKADEVAAGTIALSVVISYDATEENVDGKEVSELTHMGKTFSITFSAKSIQHSGFSTATAALKELGYDGYTSAT